MADDAPTGTASLRLSQLSRFFAGLKSKFTNTRVKGNAETDYRTGDVNLTPANIGAAATSDAVKSITRSGTTFTATRANGTTFTFTQQDNNTTYSASTSYGVTMSGTQIRRYSNVLYNNATGTTGTATLSASAANYNHMIIYFRTDDGSNYVGSIMIHSPNGKTPDLHSTHSTDGDTYPKSRTVTISGTSVATKSSEYGVGGTKENYYSHTNCIYIIRVEAWNE